MALALRYANISLLTLRSISTWLSHCAEFAPDTLCVLGTTLVHTELLATNPLRTAPVRRHSSGLWCMDLRISPTFPIYHPNSWKSYHFPTAKGTVSPMQPSDGMILVIGPRLEGHSVIFLAIQTHLSCRFLLAVDSLGLSRSGSSSQIINQAQDFPEQVPRHRHLS